MDNSIFDLSGKVALVTGAGGRLGQAFCEALAQTGADVVCVGRREEKIRKTADLISQFGHNTLCIRADVTSPADVRRMLDETLANFGKIDIAVNNAGGPINKTYQFHEMPLEDWESVVLVNLTGVFLCMQEEIKAMLARKTGSIINISSLMGVVGMTGESKRPQANYAAAKHGVGGLTKQGAVEYARHGIRVNAIAYGWFPGTSAIQSERNPEVPTEELEKQAKERIALCPMRRPGSIEEAKGQLIYLASDASNYVTGQIVIVDGGYSAQ